MRYLPLLVALLCLTGQTLAQKQNNIWYFGRNAGLDFNTNPPTALTDGALNTNEGCATICDSVGRLLFYTDGITVYNKVHQVMLGGTGLLGHKSATQSAIIVPWPGNDQRYYIFTADALENKGANGYNYSIVDLSKDNGLGEVIQKNTNLYPVSSEKLSAARHCNGKDWWIITKPADNNNFYCYLLTENGLDHQAVRSLVTTSPSEDVKLEGPGTIKVSPNLKKLSTASLLDNYLALYNFDSQTGIIYDGFSLKLPSPYGVEFSSNSKYLYVTCKDIQANTGYIYQFDMAQAKDAATMNHSRQLITPSLSSKIPVGIQLAPDNKLYISTFDVSNQFDPSIATIDHPDLFGSLCLYQANMLNLNGKKSAVGMPQVIQPNHLYSTTFLTVQATIVDTCKRKVVFEITSPQTLFDSLHWEFSDSTISNELKPEKQFPLNKDSFYITVDTKTDVLVCSQFKPVKAIGDLLLVFHSQPTASAGNDTVIISGQPLQLHAAGGTKYIWSPVEYFDNPFDPAPMVNLKKDVILTLTAFNEDGCSNTDSIHVKILKEPQINVPNAFTPNSDGLNDQLHIWLSGLSLKRFSIYNRWGETVFRAFNTQQGWDGTYKGQSQPAGTYMWLAEGTDYKGMAVTKKGSLMLIR